MESFMFEMNDYYGAGIFIAMRLLPIMEGVTKTKVLEN